ncbi:MAG TPA: hypothetical protein VGC87_12575 [Pyrinomonadaceae bacterium]|jgi:hypothetical protein
MASATAFATPPQGKRIKGNKAKKPSTRAQAEETKPDAKVQVRLTRFDTLNGHCIIANIGEFPADLTVIGQYFLEREFFERIASDVLGLDASPGSESNTALKVAMLPQKKNQREGDFIFGKVKGHIIVVVEKRHVIVACTLEEAQNQSQQIAAVKALVARLTAG